MKNHILRIELKSSLHHGSGFGISGIVDRAVLRDSYGLPYLAGSAIKGKLRHAALRTLLAEGYPACYTGDGSDWCDNSAPCSICRLFGSPRRQGSLIFTDAYPIQEMEALLTEIAKLPRPSILHPDSQTRARTAIDRRLRTVRPQALYTTETLPEYFAFEGAILGVPDTELPLLEKACLLTTHFGSDSARGLGKCIFRLHPGKESA